jgi:hypothetical protein
MGNVILVCGLKKDKETLEEYIHRMKEITDLVTKGLILHFDEAMFPDYSSQDIL